MVSTIKYIHHVTMRIRSRLRAGKTLPSPVLRPFRKSGDLSSPVSPADGQLYDHPLGYAQEDWLELIEASSDLPPRGGSHDTWNAYQHYKLEATRSTDTFDIALDVYVSNFPNAGHLIAYSDPGWGLKLIAPGTICSAPLGVPALVTTDLTASVTPSAWPLWLQNMRSQMLNESKPETSLLNALYELKDVKSLGSTVARTTKSLKALQKQLMAIPAATSKWRGGIYGLVSARNKRLRKSTKEGLKLTGLDMMKRSADWFLQWNFNIRPLIADIEAIHKAITSASKRIDRIYAMSGRRRIARFKRNMLNLPEYVDKTTESSHTVQTFLTAYRVPMGVPAMGALRQDVTYSEATLHGQMEITQECPQLSVAQARLYGLLDDLGVNLNPSIIWNARPYSFMVDWLVNVSSWLSQFRIENVRPVTVIHKCCYSLSVKRRTKRFVKYEYSFNAPYGRGWQHASNVDEKAYSRFTDSLDWVASATSGLSAREIRLASAMAVTRWPQKRKRR